MKRFHLPPVATGAPFMFGAALMILAGCIAKPPAYNENLLSVEIPDSWQSTGTRMGGTDDDWIKSFRDKKLNSLVEEVKENNYDLKIAAARVMQAAGDAKIAGASAFPIARVGLDGRRQEQAFIGLPPFDPASQAGGADYSSSLYNNFGVSLDIDWELDLWGRIRTGQAAAIADLNASQAELSGFESSLSAQTAKIWFAINEADQQLRLAEETLLSYKESERTIGDGFELANLPASQLLLAKSQTASAEALVDERRIQKKAVIRQLQILVGKYPSGNIDTPGKFASLPSPPPAGLPSDLLHRRADMVAAERRVTAADRRIREAKLALLPQISLTGSGGTATEMLQNVLDPSNLVWSVAGKATELIFAGGEVAGNVSKREAISQEAIANYQSTALKAFSEVEGALTAETVLRSREDALQRAQELLEEAYSRAMDEYKDGVGDILTILTTQQKLLQAQSQVISIQRLRLENRVDLHLALGGKFDARKADPAAGKRQH